eukprot:CAMPEP_0116951680 /NCGR_PEP_ID=MMETSP0467-20121206/40264_1 /TAXON_ID=283647 /ORGANISM="Mesodinium pulex, Strain SPMC105" /LENGTH=140 /DNA_ID=CAMNT_0004636773 /DNA_START=644 /DNA_END=1066 /DNA_ORIENTATION=-
MSTNISNKDKYNPSNKDNNDNKSAVTKTEVNFNQMYKVQDAFSKTKQYDLKDGHKEEPNPLRCDKQKTKEFESTVDKAEVKIEIDSSFHIHVIDQDNQENKPIPAEQTKMSHTISRSSEQDKVDVNSNSNSIVSRPPHNH